MKAYLQARVAIGDGAGSFVIDDVEGRAPLAGEVRVTLHAVSIAHEWAEHEGGHGWDCGSRHLEDTLRFFGATLQSSGPAS